jgi:hypothetical protein
VTAPQNTRRPPVPVTELGAVNTTGDWWHLDLEDTPQLQWPACLKIYDAMATQDAQVSSVLRAVMLPILRTPWRVDQAGARDEVCELVAADLGLDIVGQERSATTRTRGRFSWRRHLQEALMMLKYGHAYFEQVYRIDDAGRARLRKLAVRMPRTLAKINVERDGGLKSIEQWPPPGELANIDIPVSRIVAYINEQEGGNWLGQSLLRTAYKNWLIKDRLLRVQAQTIERNGMGVPVYEGAEGDDDLTAGKKLATSVRAGDNAGAAIPNTASLKLLGVEGNLPDADKAIRYHDEQISRRVLAHVLNLGTQTGSWALGSSFMDFFIMSLQVIAEVVQDIAQAHVVEDLVDLNWGEDEPAPRLVFDEIGSHQAATAQAIKLLVDAGIVFPDRKLEEFLRGSFGLPAKDLPPPEAGGSAAAS